MPMLIANMSIIAVEQIYAYMLIAKMDLKCLLML
jgi:hypothetical protein